MNFRTLTLAAAAALLAAGAQAQSSNVTLSGVVDAAARSVHNEKGTTQSLVSGANSTSRLILRGSEDLGGGLKAGFWLEGSFATDTGTPPTQFWDRQATVRLSGPWGEIRLGRDWVPSFLSYAGADTMGYVGIGGAGNLISASATTAINRAFGSTTATTSRTNNALEYWLPGNLGGVYGQVMVAPGERANAQSNFNLYGARLGYANKAINVSGHTTSSRIDATGSRWSESGLTGLYTTAGGVKFSAAWIDIKYLSSKQTNLIVGVRVPIGAHELKASYGRADQKGQNAAGASIDANDGQLFVLSYVYHLSKRSAVYANAAQIRNKGAATFALSGGPSGAQPGTNHSGYEFGIRHTF